MTSKRYHINILYDVEYSCKLLITQEIYYVTNMRLTCDMVKRLNDFDFVNEVSGGYTGTLTGRGASHERRDQTH